MPGELDPITIRARRVLLDALEALAGQRQAIVLVGAQAIYLHTGEADLAVSPFTQDADLALNPTTLGSLPVLAEAMQAAGFALRTDPQIQPGIWISQQSGVEVDLLVPETLGGPGRRSARLPGHGQNTARKVRGLEAVLVDQEPMTLTALEVTDTRHMEVTVAGPGALLVAKLHKVAERQDETHRRKPKDALDIFRLLQGVSTEALASRLERLSQEQLSQETTREALQLLRDLFGTEAALGAQLAADAAFPLIDREFITASSVALTEELLAALSDS
jgi:hypothetical protein